ncbi:hypothetical protein OG407_37675 [Streptomyces sp. NBC_01515]|uniref:hypothetical protein n=1 Tax=Streptomyces sp. NBC_01515 TaxID=2903890 RepID=UPI003863449F
MNDPRRFDETAELAGLGGRLKVYRCHRPWRHEELALLPTLAVDGAVYGVTKSWWLTAPIAVLVLVASFKALRRIPPREGLRQVVLYDGGLLLAYADGPPVPVPWDAIESTEVDHGAVESKGIVKVETRRRFATVTVHLRKKRQPLVLMHVVGQYTLAKAVEEALRPGLLDRMRGTLDAEGRVELGRLAVTGTGLVLPGPDRGGAEIALEWAELDETRADGLTKVWIRPRHAKEWRVEVRNATVVRDFIEETRSLSA